MDIARCELEQRKMDGQHKQNIFKKATALADKWKEKKCTEDVLDQTFEQMWDDEGFNTHSENTEYDIRLEVDQILHTTFVSSTKYLTEEVQKRTSKRFSHPTGLVGSLKADDIGKHDFGLNKSNFFVETAKAVKEKFSNKTEWQKTQESVLYDINGILGKVEANLNDYKQSIKQFQPQYANTVLKILKEEISCLRSEARKVGVSILPPPPLKQNLLSMFFAMQLLFGRQCRGSITKYTVQKPS